MKTNTQLANLAASVAFLAATLSLPRAEAHVHGGQYYIAYQPTPGAIAVHTEATSNPKQAFERFADAATNGAWLVLVVPDDEAGEVDPLIEHTRYNGTRYVGDRTGQTLHEARRRYAYEVQSVSTEVAQQLVGRYLDSQLN